MSGRLASGPQAHGGPGPEHSSMQMLDLDYANERLRAEPPQNDNGDYGSQHSSSKGLNGTRAQHGESRARGSATKGSSRSRFSLGRKTEIILAVASAMLLAVLVFCLAVFTVQAQARCRPSSTSGTNPNPSGVVNLSYGSYQGTSLANGVDQFLGMRYATAPARFSAPQYPQNFSGVQQAFQVGPGCIGEGSPDSTTAEDCLFVDVYTPTKRSSTSKFPVFVFIQGGGLITAKGHTNGSGLVIASNMNMVTVSFSYRVGLFGFLASLEVQANGSLNNGYLDQHQLLQWVQKEIPKFGGDPSHVVIGGQSAGAGSVVNHLTAYGGADQHLFQGAIMESQSMPPIRNVSEQQFQYDNLVKKTGCDNTTDTLDCLRGLPYTKLLSHGGAIPYPDFDEEPVYAYNPVVDNKFITDVPMNMFSQGQFVHVPTIFGDDTNEGTVFTPHNLKSLNDTLDFMQANYPTLTSDHLKEYSDMYSFDKGTDDDDYWLKASWAYGETRYICPGIRMSSLIANHSDSSVWNWRYNIATPAQVASSDFVSHGSEVPAIFGPEFSPQTGQTQMLATNATQTVTVMQGYWVSFITTLDPNKAKPPVAPTWDAWNGTNRVLFDFNGTAMEIIDKSTLSRCGYISQIMVELQQ